MHSLEVLKRFLTNRSLRFSYLSEMGLLKWMPDSMYLKNKYRTLLGRKLDLDNPKSFNEKLQWLKIHDRKSAYTTMVDKYAVKRFNSPIVRPLSDLTQRDNHILFFI
jgi:hypothetical protein